MKRAISAEADLESGDGLDTIYIPQELNGYNLTDIAICIHTVSTSGLVTIQLYNVTDSQDMLTTKATIDQGERTSYTAVTQPQVNGSYDDVATGDRLRIDVDGKGTGVKGLDVYLTFEEA